MTFARRATFSTDSMGVYGKEWKVRKSTWEPRFIIM